MNIAVLNESSPGEARVALMPDSVQKLVAAKASVSIESGAGLGAARTDDDYRSVGANVVADRNALLSNADMLVVVNRPSEEDLRSMKKGAAVVEAYHVRAAAGEQVRSLGAKFLEVDLGGIQTEDKGGYAVELSAEALQRGRDLVAEHAKTADVVITTAQVPGRRAPVLIEE